MSLRTQVLLNTYLFPFLLVVQFHLGGQISHHHNSWHMTIQHEISASNGTRFCLRHGEQLAKYSLSH